jgi:hypothetical protein
VVATSIDRLFADVAVIKKMPKASVSATPTYNPANTQAVLTAPTYREHLSSLTDTRLNQSSQALLQQMFKQNPDASAAVGAYQTLADTPLTMVVRNAQGQIDPAATAQLPPLIRALTFPTDYSAGFTAKPSLATLCQEMRYMVMLRGALANELVFDKKLVPTRLQHIDMASIQWTEKTAGDYKPSQRVQGKSNLVSLDFPSVFVSWYRRDPTTIYSQSDFVSVINAAAAQTQVVNDLYRIMTITGFPRMEITVLEEVLAANMPASIKDNTDPNIGREWVNARIQEVAGVFGSLRSDQAFVHTDSVETKVLNDKNPGASLDISSVMDTLNAQSQAALKTMATVIGRGSGAAGVASVEARIAAMNADQLNVCVKEQLDKALTFLINSYGIQGFVDSSFAPAELRPSLELEAQRTMRSARLLVDLSHGIITDEEYHMQVHGRLPPVGSKPLSGTGFQDAAETGPVDASAISPNDDPLGRSVSAAGDKSAKSNGLPGSKKPGKSK